VAVVQRPAVVEGAAHPSHKQPAAAAAAHPSSQRPQQQMVAAAARLPSNSRAVVAAPALPQLLLLAGAVVPRPAVVEVAARQQHDRPQSRLESRSSSLSALRYLRAAAAVWPALW
jgi:hypothetical protein